MEKRKEHSIWVERFRPQTLKDYICNAELKETFQKWIDTNDIPHCIFAGHAGIGKSSLAKLLVKNIKCDYLYINASDENGIETIREKVKSFASSASFNPLKIVILEEASFLTGPAQEALKQIIEDYSFNTRFIFTCNYLNKITEPILSRCKGNIYKFTETSKGEIAKRLTEILDIENVSYDLQDIVKLINSHYPDIRSMIGVLQADTKDNKFTLITLNLDWVDKAIDVIKSRDKKAWYTIRQLAADAQVEDYQPVYRYLFDNLEKFSWGHDAEISVVLDDHIWRSASVVDKEINFAAAISRILDITKKQVL